MMEDQGRENMICRGVAGRSCVSDVPVVGEYVQRSTSPRAICAQCWHAWPSYVVADIEQQTGTRPTLSVWQAGVFVDVVVESPSALKGGQWTNRFVRWLNTAARVVLPAG